MTSAIDAADSLTYYKQPLKANKMTTINNNESLDSCQPYLAILWQEERHKQWPGHMQIRAVQGERMQAVEAAAPEHSPRVTANSTQSPYDSPRQWKQ